MNKSGVQRVYVIVVAAGRGRRFGSRKQWVELKGKGLVEGCVERFDRHPQVSDIVLVLNKENLKQGLQNKFCKLSAVVVGGKERQDSVIAGLKEISPGENGIVLIHDGVRPLVSEELITRVIQAAREKGAAIPGIPVEDTVKKIQKNKVLGTLDRDSLCRAQTPQGFRYGILASALERARRDHYCGTDEASLVERMGGEVVVVPGEYCNIKITTPLDLKIAEVLFEHKDRDRI